MDFCMILVVLLGFGLCCMSAFAFFAVLLIFIGKLIRRHIHGDAIKVEDTHAWDLFTAGIACWLAFMLGLTCMLTQVNSALGALYAVIVLATFIFVALAGAWDAASTQDRDIFSITGILVLIGLNIVGLCFLVDTIGPATIRGLLNP